MTAAKRAGLDTSTTGGKHVQKRLEKEIVIWLATTNPNGRPMVVPVWFLWDGKSFLLYSVPGQKVNNIERNPQVEMHFNSTADGDDIVRIDGTATVPKTQAPANRTPAYIAKYRRLIKAYGMTPESFSADYRIPIRVRPTRFR